MKETDSPYKSPATEDFEHEELRVSKTERSLLAKSRVYMFLFSLIAWCYAGFYAIQTVFHLYWWLTWDDAFADQLGWTHLELLGTVASRFAYTLATGAFAYAMWKWAVSIRAAYTGADKSETVARWQL